MADKTVFATFEVNAGGPYATFLEQLKPLNQDRDTRVQRAAILVAIAWGVPLILAAAGERALGVASDGPYLLNLNAWARYFLGVGLFVLTERQVSVTLQNILSRFFDAPLVEESSRSRALDLVNLALRRRNSTLPEAVIAALAILSTVVSAQFVANTADPSWMAQPDDDGVMRLTAAGIWGLFVSGSIFFFLLYRWIWRFVIWSRLLAGLSTLELRLTVQHPDKMGGLAFVGLTPIAFAPLVFVLSLWIASVCAQLLVRGELTVTTFSGLMLGWLLFIHAVLALPLLTFSAPLNALKDRVLRIASAQATRGLADKEKGLISQDLPVADGPAPAFPPAALYGAAQRLSTVLFNRATIVPVSFAALLPLALAGSTQFPFKEVLGVMKKLVLF